MIISITQITTESKTTQLTSGNRRLSCISISRSLKWVQTKRGIKVDGAKVTTAFTKTAVTDGYECSYTPGTALADGAHTVSIEASDYDGNAASAKTVSFTVDTIPPTLTLTNPADELITNKTALVVSGKTDDVTSKPVTVTVNGASVTVNSDGSFSKEITLVSGSNTITVVATDKAGKTTTVTRKVTLDTGAPVFEKVTLTPNPVDCGKTFVISVKVTDQPNVVIKLEGVVDSVPVVFTRRDGDWWETTVPKTLNGVYVVELTATDEAGNIAYTAKYILTIDITALRVKLQRYPYSAKVRVGRYFARLK